MAKQETYRINLEAVDKNVSTILSQISTLFNKTGEKTNAVENEFAAITKQVPEFSKKIKEALSLESIDKSTLTEITTEYKALLKSFVTLVNFFKKQNLTQEVTEQLNEIDKEIEDKQKEIKQHYGRIRGHSNKLLPDESDLTTKAKNKIFKDIAPSNLSIGDTMIPDWQTFNQILEQTKNSLPKKELKELLDIQKQVNDVIRDTVRDTQSKNETDRQEIIALKNEIATLIANKQAITENGSQNKELVKILTSLMTNITNLQSGFDNTTDSVKQFNQNEKKAKEEAEQTNTAVGKQDNTFKKAAKQVFSYGTILTALKRVYRETINTIKGMDEALTGMAVVTNMSREDTWQLANTFQKLGHEVGMAGTEVANIATKFYQQGKSTSQVLQLTEAAAKAATIAGIDGARSVDLLTNAMNGFQLSADQAMNVSDKFAALAASAATDYEELAVALSKVAAQANLAGLSMDFTLGMLTKGIETTREAPETIGTALKTIISRMRELTDYGKTLEDGMDVNRVAKALDNVGIQLMDENNQFRDLEQVLTETGQKWDTLNKNQQANIAIAFAGTRQQSRFIAMMQDFDRTQELASISANSYGATLAQQGKYMEGLGAAMTRLQNSWQQLITAATNSDIIIGVVNVLSGAIQILADNAWLLIPIMGTLIALSIKHTFALAAEAVAGNTSKIVEEQNIAVRIAAALIRKKHTQAINEETGAIINQNLAIQQNSKNVIDSTILGAFKKGGSVGKFFKSIGKGFKFIFKAIKAIASSKIVLLLIGISFIITGIAIGIDQNVNAIKHANEALEKMQVELYELRNGTNQIKSLEEEFDKLSGKINKSADDLNRLKEIAQQINDIAGYEAVDITADAATQQAQIAGVLTYREEKEKSLIQDMTKQIGKAKRSKNLSDIQAESGNEAIKSSIKTVIEFNTRDLMADVSASTRNALITGLSKQADTIFNKEGEYNTEAVENLITPDLLSKVDQALSTGKLEDYQKALGKINGELTAEQKLLTDSMPIFEAVGKMNKETAQAIDRMQLGPEKMNQLWAEFGDELNTLDQDTLNTIDSSSKLYEVLADQASAQLQINKHMDKDTRATKEKAYNDALTKYNGLAADAEEKKKKGKELSENEAKALRKAATDLSAAEKEYRAATDAEGLYFEQTEKLRDLLATVSLESVSNAITNLTSKFDRLSKSILDSNLSFEDTLSLMKDYPELANKIRTGSLTGADLTTVLEGQLAQTRSTMTTAITAAATEAAEATGMSLDSSSELDVLTALANMEGDELETAITTYSEPFEDKKQARKDFLQKQNAAKDALQVNETLQLFNKEGWDQVIKPLLDKYSDIALNNQQLDKQKTILKGLTYGTEEYNKAESQYVALANESIRLSEEEIQASKDKIQTNYEDLGSLQDYISYQDGILTLGDLAGLDDDEKHKVQATYLLMQSELEKIDTQYANINDKEKIGLELEKQKTEFLNKQLEDRKKQYQDYFSEIDKIEETQEKKQSRQDLIQQIASLTGAVDGASKSKVKDLRKELADLDKDIQKQRKQDMRDSLMKSIDEQIEANNTKLEENTKAIETNSALRLQGKDVPQAKVQGSHAKGGYVNYTGLAMVHGSPASPEAFLSAQDTLLMRTFLDSIGSAPAHMLVDSGQGISIGAIQITTNQLNTQQDFKNAGRIMAAEFNNQIKKRGITLNGKQ